MVSSKLPHNTKDRLKRDLLPSDRAQRVDNRLAETPTAHPPIPAKKSADSCASKFSEMSPQGLGRCETFGCFWFFCRGGRHDRLFADDPVSF
jgi:hypothetical protein